MNMELTLPDMTCGHCERAVKAIVHTLDPKAEVRVDLARHHVEIDSVLPRQQLEAALAAQGYPPA
jgi:copper chaperone